MKEIDFATLTLQDALDFAVLVEEEACERYEDLAAQMETHDTRAAADFFRFMVKNEAKHGQELAARRTQMFGSAPSKVDRSMLWDVEAPDFNEVRAFMAAREALEVALHAEKKAYQFFADAVIHVTDPDVRALFEELREEELMHQDLVRREIAKLPESPLVDINDYADEPMPQ
ncbi:MAG: rubrerythrin [Acidobacteria bacterium]|nr:rubrerythrin [Acidobacteriota bacterium]